MTEPPPLPEPPERGSKTTIEPSIVVAEELGATSRVGELTELVRPLKLGLDTEPVRKSARRSRRRIMYVGAALAIFGAVALAVVLVTGGELPKPIVSQHPPIVEPTAPPAPSAVAPKAEIVGEAVASGSPVAPVDNNGEAVAAPTVVAAPAPAIEAPVNDAPVLAAAPVAQPKAAAVKPVPLKAAVSKPVAHKAIAHPVKKAAKPKYDPDALFFKGN